MKIVKILLGLVLALVALFLIIGLFAPKDIHVERSITINAPGELIMEHLKSWQKADAWSPWNEDDPNMVKTYEGEDGTVGSVSAWSGNKDVGKGSQKIVAITENQVDYELTIIEPWESVSTGSFITEPDGDGTKVSWSFDARYEYPMNAMNVFMSMDKMLGPYFEKGLIMLKEITEKEFSSGVYNGYTVEEIERPASSYITFTDTINIKEIGAFFGQHFPGMYASSVRSGIQPAGQPCGLYHHWNEQSGTTILSAGMPVASIPSKPLKGYESVVLPAGKALKIAYYGAYEKVGGAHMAMDSYMRHRNLTQVNPVIEEYMTDPTTEPDTSKWLTNVYYMIK
jgi:effector-binding domain-containing protein